MTCIVGLVDNGKVYMGADSLGAESHFAKRVRKDPKLFRVGEFVFGFTTSFRMGQLLGYGLSLPYHQPDAPQNQYMHTSFINHIRDVFKTGGFTSQDNGQEQGGRFLVGYRGSLYFVDADFQLGETLCGYDSVGCGSDIAMGSLFSTLGKPPSERLEIALSAAEAFSAGVGSPFLFMETPE